MVNKKLIKELTAFERRAMIKQFKKNNDCYNSRSRGCRQCRDNWLLQQANNMFSIDGPAILSF